MDNGRELADFSINYGNSLGVDYIEARYIDSTTEGFSLRNGEFIGVQSQNQRGIGIRLIVDGGMSFVSSDQLDKVKIQNAITWAVKQAKLANRKKKITFSQEKVYDTRWKTPVKTSFADITSEEKQQFMIDIDNDIKSLGNGAVISRFSILSLSTEKKYFVTNESAKIDSENSIFSYFGMNTAKGDLGVEQRMFSMAGTGGWEWENEIGLKNLIRSDCEALIKTANKAKSVNFPKPIDVIVSGEVAGIMAHENVGHPSEGDRIAGREGAQAGESFYADLLQTQKLGEAKLGSPEVTIIDDPTMKGGAGFYLYDDEGVKSRPRYLIKEGMLNELLLNREYGAYFGVNSNAAARSVSYNREPITRMANTYFAPGNYGTDEIFEDVKDGIFMKSFTEWNIDDRRFQSKYVGLEAYLIKNGKLTNEMVKRPVLELTTFGILSNVDAVSKEMYTPSGTCGKGDPAQGVPVSMGGPYVRLRKITVGDGN